MEDQIILLNMMLLLLLGGLCSVIFRKLKMPAIIGYLTTGIILANYWAGESQETLDIVDFLSSLGLVLMMFCIGMELNLKKIRKCGSFAIMVMMIQIPLMLLGGYLSGLLLGLTSLQAIIFGAIISGSSTAVVTTVLAEQDRLTHSEVDTIILITVIEDVAQVLILSAVSPMLVGETMSFESIVWMLLTIIVFMVSVMLIGLVTIPRLLDWVGSKMPDEILLIIALGFCFFIAWLSTLIGLSMAIGAFMTGVIVSQARVAKGIEHDVTPMKDIFMMMFFISIGLEIRPESLLDNLLLIFVIYLIYLVLKTSSVFVAYFIGNKSLRLSFMSSISLVAMGEFAFIIGKSALDAGVISNSFYTAVIGAALVSMIMLPLLERGSDRFCTLVQNKAPQAAVNVLMKVEKFRSDYYAKLSLASKTTMTNFRTRATYAYFDAVVIFVIELVFFVSTPYLTQLMYDNIGPLPLSTANTIVMLLNFLVLIPPLYKMIYNLKFVERVLVDAERKAVSTGTGNLDRRYMKVSKLFIEVNIWMVVFLLDFVILLVVPNDVGFWSHILVTLAGIAVIIGIWTYGYLRKS
ncbi:MAG: cation:proton antiporter [Methanomethylophilus sp.]